jgi:hypothetical protein
MGGLSIAATATCIHASESSSRPPGQACKRKRWGGKLRLNGRMFSRPHVKANLQLAASIVAFISGIRYLAVGIPSLARGGTHGAVAVAIALIWWLAAWRLWTWRRAHKDRK